MGVGVGGAWALSFPFLEGPGPRVTDRGGAARVGAIMGWGAGVGAVTRCDRW